MTEDSELRQSIDRLSGTIGDLRVIVAELRVEVRTLILLENRVARLEAWKNKVTGGLVLISIAIVAMGGVIANRVLGIK